MKVPITDQLPQPATITEMYLASIAKSLEDRTAVAVTSETSANLHTLIAALVSAIEDQTAVFEDMLTELRKLTVTKKDTK